MVGEGQLTAGGESVGPCPCAPQPCGQWPRLGPRPYSYRVFVETTTSAPTSRSLMDYLHRSIHQATKSSIVVLYSKNVQ